MFVQHYSFTSSNFLETTNTHTHIPLSGNKAQRHHTKHCLGRPTHGNSSIMLQENASNLYANIFFWHCTLISMKYRANTNKNKIKSNKYKIQGALHEGTHSVVVEPTKLIREKIRIF